MSQTDVIPQAGHPQTMLIEIYIEALLVDEELADQVWDTWDKGEISDFFAACIWWRIFLEARPWKNRNAKDRDYI